MRRRLVLFAVLVAVAAAPATAEATSTLGYQANGTGTGDDVVTVSGSSVQGYEVSYSASGCAFIFSCAFEISSPNGFTDSASNCNAVAAPNEYACDADAGAADVQLPGRVSVAGTDGNELVTNGCTQATVGLTFTGGAGDDQADIGCGASDIDLGPGDDDGVFRVARGLLFGTGGSGAMRGGDGDDRLTGAGGADTLLGDAGRDFVIGGGGADTLDGGDGNDVVEGESGNDTVNGGRGRDTLNGGPGTDSIAGGDSADTVTYEDSTQPVTIALDGAAGDGEPGENDTIAGDVEDAIGGAGDDTILGGGGNNEIEGGDGGDVIDGLGGRDTIDGGTGNDRITSRDGVQESIECGDGNDLAVTDEFDSALNCETVQASRELMPDVDNDGVPAPLDCDDRNASRRPGLPDKPGNRVDENCDGGDTPFARVVTPVQSVFSTSRGRTKVLRLRVLDIPAGAVIQLRCKGGKKRDCFKGTKRFRIRRGAASKNIRGPVKNRQLKAKARLEVRVLAPDSIGKVVQYAMRKGKRLPATTLRCIDPGAKSAKKC